jgi:hypothetical protein
MVHQLPKRSTPGEVIALLSVAENPSTPSSQLASLQRNRSRLIRQAVAANPNLDVEQFDTAALGFPESVLENPVLDWLLLEDANWLEGLAPRARHQLLCTPTISPNLLWWAARFGTPTDQLSVLANPNTPAEVVAWIAEQNAEGHSRVAAQHRLHHSAPIANWITNPNANPNAKPLAKGRDDRSEPGSLAFAEETAQQEIRTLSLQNFSSDAVLLFGCSSLPPWIQPVLASADTETRRMLSNHPDAAAATLEILAFDDEEDIRARVAQRPSLPAETQKLLQLLGHLPQVGNSAGNLAHNHDSGANDLAVASASNGGAELNESNKANQPKNLPELGKLGKLNNLNELDELDKQGVAAYLEAKFAASEQSLLKRWIAVHPLAPESVLQVAVISSDWHIREAAAANPSITLGIAALALLDSDKDVRIALALNPACPAEFLNILLIDTNESVRDAAEANPSHLENEAPARIAQTRRLLLQLAKQTPAVRRLLAQLPNQSVNEQRAFARDDEWEVRLACASNPNTGFSVLALLVDDPDVDVRKAVASHQNLDTANRLRLLSDQQPSVREALVAQANAEVLDRLSQDESVTVRAAVANHPLASAAILERLGEDGDLTVREHVAAHPQSSIATRVRLAASEEPAVKRAILKWAGEANPTASQAAQVISVLLGANAGDAQTWTRLRQGDPTLSRAKLHRLAYATDWGTDTFIGPNTAPKALSVLSGFNDWRLRQAVAKHPNAPEATIALLARDSDYDVRTSAAQHPLLRQRDLKRLGSDPHFAVRLAIAERPDTPADVLDTMIFDDTEHVREAVLANPRLGAEALALHNRVMLGALVPQRALTKLAKGNSMIRKIVASHPQCRAKLRAELAVDSDWRIREAVAAHPSAEAPLLATLAGDGDRDVRAAVASHHNTPLPELLLLAADSDHNVRTAVLNNPKLAESQRQACLVSAYRRCLISPIPTERLAALLSPLCSSRHLNRRATWQSPQWIERFVVAGHRLATDAVLQHQSVNDAHICVLVQADESLRNRERNREGERNRGHNADRQKGVRGAPTTNTFEAKLQPGLHERKGSRSKP